MQEGSAWQQAHWCQGHGPGPFLVLVFFQDSSSVMKEDGAENALPGTSCPWTVKGFFLFFFSSTYLCGKISTFTIYSFSVFTQHVICWLWNSLIWIVEEKEGEFSEISIYYSWCLERCVGLCFFTNEKIILIETESGSKLCWFQRVQPLPLCHLADKYRIQGHCAFSPPHLSFSRILKGVIWWSVELDISSLRKYNQILNLGTITSPVVLKMHHPPLFWSIRILVNWLQKRRLHIWSAFSSPFLRGAESCPNLLGSGFSWINTQEKPYKNALICWKKNTHKHIAQNFDAKWFNYIFFYLSDLKNELLKHQTCNMGYTLKWWITLCIFS